jgi:hypothetical protein
MSKGIFTDKIHKPTNEEVIEILESIQPLWQDIVNFIEIQCKAKGEFKFYGKNYGWALRFNKSGKSLAALYPSENEFTVQIILNTKQVEKALEEALDIKMKNIIIDTPEIHEGKWVYINVTSESDIMDIKKLLFIRSNWG